jgi:hypothetical protein
MIKDGGPGKRQRKMGKPRPGEEDHKTPLQCVCVLAVWFGLQRIGTEHKALQAPFCSESVDTFCPCRLAVAACLVRVRQ